MKELREHPTKKKAGKVTPNGHRMGWIKDPKSVVKNLMTPQSPKVKAFFDHIKSLPLADEVDLREYASPIEDQGALGSCTANAAMGCVELSENKEYGEYKDGSRLFLYYNTRHLIENTSGDVGATVTDTFTALTDYGVCTEQLYPYDISQFDDEPPEECYTEALNYQTLEQVAISSLQEIKEVLNAGYPIELGFFVFDSFEYDIGSDGIMPIPDMDKESLLGGHAIEICGYKQINNVEYLICRNSWGESFGDLGYFYLPVEYLDMKYDYYGYEYDCVSDYRVLIKQEYMSEGNDEESGF